MAAVVATAPQSPLAVAQTRAPEGQGFNLNTSDLRFILRQIQISENNAETGQALLGTGAFQVEDATLPFGLRTVDGTDNNLLPNQSRFGAADTTFPRLSSPFFRPGEKLSQSFGPDDPAGADTSYASKRGFVEDSQPRVASNLIVDQTTDNPAAVAAAGPGAVPEGGPNGPLPIPNVAPDVGLSAPFNSWFTLFGQFFDHGLDLTNKGGGTVYAPLKADDPLIAGKDRILDTADDLPPHLRFMVLTRTQNQPGPDGIAGDQPGTPDVDESADDVKEHTNQTTSFVDQNQTYTSNPSHQVFLREYTGADASVAPKVGPKLTGKLVDGGIDGGLATWARVKAQAAAQLGIQLTDLDVLNVPEVKVDAYGRFLAGPNGFAQLVMKNGTVVEGDPSADGGKGVLVPAADAKRTGHAFLDDIAHHASPRSSRGVPLAPDTSAGTADDNDPATYDDEMLNAHFTAGDGRLNENIGLTAVHHVFHSEHNRLVGVIDGMITNVLTDAEEAAWKNATSTGGEYWDYGERLFQAARFVTEMEYQHLVFEEFGRKVQPQINLFGAYDNSINPAIVAEFAHATYRFGHSMLNEQVERVDNNGSKNDVGLIEAFLNPPEFLDNGRYANADAAVGAIVRGMTRQVGNEIDEFVTEALRNNLLGLPLDLATINMLRGRDAGVKPLNEARKDFFAANANAALRPYNNWVDFGVGLRHIGSLQNFVAAYGKHPSIVEATTNADKRKAANVLISGATDPAGGPVPADSAAFMEGTGAWATAETGLNEVDFWVGGLAEKTAPFGGLLGSTMNYVFETQMENLQDGDRFYYLARTAGLNLLVQLEGNSLAEIIARNSDAGGLPADTFSRPDFVFDLDKQTNATGIVDDPATEVDERTVLTRLADGTIRFNGPQHVNWIGRDTAVDKVHSSEGDDTLRGNGGDDRMEGAAGNDSFIGGLGNDILTDLFGDDVLKGGNGHDALSSGQGFDLNQGGLGDDFVVGGSDPTETFAGAGDDMVFGGDSSDTVFGDDGDDWIQGGGQADLLQGDNGAPFQNDPNDPGSDVIIGEGGNDDYDAEGGNDIMVAGPGIERNEGLLGFDWAAYKGDSQPADADMFFTGLLPDTLANNRDRFDVTEALSGHDQNDSLKGDNRLAADMVGHELNAAGIAQITGLANVLPVGAGSFTGGNILLGGAGSDTLEGRRGNDILDGDRWLNVQLQAPELTTTDPADKKLVDNMSSLRADVLAGRMNGSQITIARRIETAVPGTSTDTAVFAGPRADYNITPNLNRTIMTITHARGTLVDGTDIVRNVENLRFSDQTVVIRPIASITPTSMTFATRQIVPTAASAAQTATLRNTGVSPLTIASITLAGANPGDYAVSSTTCGATLAAGANCLIRVTFRPTAAGTRTAILRVTDDSDNVPGSTQEVALTGTATANPVASLTPASLTFASRMISPTASATQTATLRNTGVAPLNIAGTALTGTDPGDYVISSTTCGATLAAGASCLIRVAFRPTAVGTRTAILRVTNDSNSVPGSTQDVSLTGTGTPANSPATGRPVIDDATPQSGQTLNVSTASIADADGLGSFRYQWQQTSATGTTFSNITAATNTSLPVPATGSSGRQYRVVVSFTDLRGTVETVTSEATSRTTAGANTTTAPTSGT